MSAAGHEAAAVAHEAEAQQSAAAQPITTEPVNPCAGGIHGPCWTNPADKNREVAQRHLRIAAEHRAAERALVAAESQACSGISEADRGISPFQRREDLDSVAELRGPTKASRSGWGLDGAEVSFRPTKGLTAEWLQHAIDCHVARNAAIGFDAPDMRDCPLGVKGASAVVRSRWDHLVVEIRSNDPAAANEIWRRSQQLAPLAK